MKRAAEATQRTSALTSATGNARPASAGAREVQLLVSIAGITNAGIAQPMMMSDAAVATNSSASARTSSERYGLSTRPTSRVSSPIAAEMIIAHPVEVLAVFADF